MTGSLGDAQYNQAKYGEVTENSSEVEEKSLSAGTQMRDQMGVSGGKKAPSLEGIRGCLAVQQTKLLFYIL